MYSAETETDADTATQTERKGERQRVRDRDHRDRKREKKVVLAYRLWNRFWCRAREVVNLEHEIATTGLRAVSGALHGVARARSEQTRPRHNFVSTKARRRYSTTAHDHLTLTEKPRLLQKRKTQRSQHTIFDTCQLQICRRT
jgi:hypothetical protein